MALVTGAARGQGAAEVAAFAGQGVQVVATDIVEAPAGLVRPGVAFRKLDVASEDAWQRTVDDVLREFGRLDILVNNAAIMQFGSLAELEVDGFMDVLRVNLLGTALGMKSCLPALSRSAGSIINISSISGLVGRVNQGAYMASKWAIRGLTKTAALEFANYGVRVNTIIPGLIATEMTRAAWGEERLQLRGSSLPAGRPGEPQDIASMALFLASDLASFCTGAEFVCDGGETAGPRAG